MNEFSLLVALLSRKRLVLKNKLINEQKSILYGSTKEEICETLHITGITKTQQFYKELEKLSKNLKPFGLTVKRNPINGYWFITSEHSLSQFLQFNPFGDRERIAATFFIILLLFLKNNRVTLSELRKHRQKSSLNEELEFLEKEGWIIVKEGDISLTPLVGYYFDFSLLLEILEKDPQFVPSFVSNHAQQPSKKKENTEPSSQKDLIEYTNKEQNKEESHHLKD